MNRLVWMSAILCGAIAMAACGGAQDPKEAAAPGATAAAQGEVCPTASPGPPPTCPEGCTWNGAECRKNRPIVIVDAPPPMNTSPAPSVPAPIQQNPVTPP